MNRREVLKGAGAAMLSLGVSAFPLGWTRGDDKSKKRILMYTRSEGFEYPVVKRKGTELSLAETIATDLGKKHGFEVTCEKDGRVFVSDSLKDYDGFLFESQGDLGKEKSLDHQPPVTPDGKKNLLRLVAEGKGFVGCHCASDTYHSPGHDKHKWSNQDPVDPYIAMVGGEFAGHGAQQRATMHVVDAKFPGIKDDKDFGLLEEWYSLKNFAPDLHVILVQETKGMRNLDYERPEYPATWARMHEKGRVFFTSMGHRDDVWKNPMFHELLLGGLAWALGNVDADVTPNIDKAAPNARQLPQEAKKKG
jgi:type 1 glutamine amidotransferase